MMPISYHILSDVTNIIRRTRTIASSHERKDPRGAAAAATVCGPRSLASGLAAGGDEERGSVSSTDRLFT